MTTRVGGPSLAELRDDDVVRADQVAKWLAISVRTLQRAGIPYIAIGPRTRRYRVADVRGWLQQHVRGAA